MRILATRLPNNRRRPFHNQLLWPCVAIRFRLVDIVEPKQRFTHVSAGGLKRIVNIVGTVDIEQVATLEKRLGLPKNGATRALVSVL